MATTTTCLVAIKNFELVNNCLAEEAEHVKLYCQQPPITKMEAALNNLKACKHLAMSTNQIDRIVPLPGCINLNILSLGRNSIKRIEKLEDSAATLEQLWISYNLISTLDGLSGLINLTTLYISNNQIKSWAELDKLASLDKLSDVLFVGNPIYDDFPGDVARCRIEVLRHLPQVSKIDGDMVKPGEKEKAQALNETTA